MKRVTWVCVAFVLGLLAGCTAEHSTVLAGSSDLRKAFEHHEQQEYPEVKADYPKAGGVAFVLSERWKNYQKYAATCPAIAEVTQVVVTKTAGDEHGGEYVITLRGPSSHEGKDGFGTDVCSLWVNGGQEGYELEVRDFTPY